MEHLYAYHVCHAPRVCGLHRSSVKKRHQVQGIGRGLCKDATAGEKGSAAVGGKTRCRITHTTWPLLGATPATSVGLSFDMGSIFFK